MIKFGESSIPVNYAQKLMEADLEWDPSITQKMYEVFFVSVSDFLGLAKSKDRKTALAVKDLKGNFKFAAVVSYHANENEDMPGNWSYEFTFDEADIAEATVYLSTDTQFQRVLTNSAYSLHKMQFTMPIYTQQMIESVVSILKQWLDVNAKEGEEVSLELPGYFVSSVVVENGEKVLSIVPDGAMKRLIKDDSQLED